MVKELSDYRRAQRILGISRGISTAAKRINEIREAKQKTEQESRLLDLKEKQIGLQIDELEAKNEITRANADLRRTFMNEFFGKKKKVIEANNIQLDEFENSHVQQFDQLNESMDSIAHDPMNVRALGMILNPGQKQPATNNQPGAIDPTQDAIKSSLGDLGLEVQMDMDLGGGMRIKSKKDTKPTDTQQFRQDAQRFLVGDLSERQLRFLYPEPKMQDQIDVIIAEKTPAERNPNFREGFGLEAKFSPNVAKVTPEMRSVIRQIRTQQDLDFVLSDATYRNQLKKSGINLDNFDKTLREMFIIDDTVPELENIGDFSDLRDMIGQ